ncbi:MAG: ABC transporter permease [Clostridiales bacterium]|nr:ABC transporter permease [Clostridiales bacterium]
MPFDQLFPLLLQGTWESLYMTFASTFFSYLLGLPLGIALVVTEKDGLMPNRPINAVLNVLVNILRSAPFLILIMALTDVTRAVMGTSLGSSAIVFPLVIAAFPYVGRLVEGSIREVEGGIVEAMKSMGARPMQIILKAYLPEAMPSLIIGAALATTTILGYSAMAGIVGGGGLGAIAINYGYYKYQYEMMYICLALLILLVQVIQKIGNLIARKVDKRR